MGESGKPVRVVVVDDSLVAREMLAQILSSDPDIEVVGTASDGMQGLEMVERLRPDLITMDIHMPVMDGLAATERIMAYTPTPILVVSSSVHGEGIGRAFDALAAGALDVIKKPEPKDWSDLDRIGRDVIRRVKVLSRVKVITHIKGRRDERAQSLPESSGRAQRTLVAIGSSTGGPSALQTILRGLPPDLPTPVLVAQHMAEGFIPGLVAWLKTGCRMAVKPAEDGETVEPGVVYFAPAGKNLVTDGLKVRFRDPGPDQLYLPSADTLFESVSRSHGEHAVGVILTGMGADGAAGLKRLHDAGAATIAQDRESSTVWGMPRAAIELEAARYILSVDDIAAEIERLVTEG